MKRVVGLAGDVIELREGRLVSRRFGRVPLENAKGRALFGLYSRPQRGQ